ncbi:MAG: hypothetical protein ACPG1A_10425 [Halioglobus sp.]
MPSSWIKGLATWISGLVFAILMLAAGTATSAGHSPVGAIEPLIELELPGLNADPSITARTV